MDQSIIHIILCHLLITGFKFSSFFMSDFIDHNGAWSTKYNSSVYGGCVFRNLNYTVPNEYANYTLNSQIPGRPHHNLISFPSTNIKPSKDVFMTMLWSIIKPFQQKHQTHIWWTSTRGVTSLQILTPWVDMTILSMLCKEPLVIFLNLLSNNRALIAMMMPAYGFPLAFGLTSNHLLLSMTKTIGEISKTVSAGETISVENLSLQTVAKSRDNWILAIPIKIPKQWQSTILPPLFSFVLPQKIIVSFFPDTLKIWFSGFVFVHFKHLIFQ